MKPLKWFLSNQRKISMAKQKNYGFTVIELLVSMILAALIITPLLWLMVNVLDNDSKEQAKATTDQEMKAALDFISRDLQQAVYIYDADGIDNIRKQLPKYDLKEKFFPVLVFWKRQYISGGIQVATNQTDDTFVYSLVAYYVIKDDDNTWSKAARIGRFQISNGYGSTETEINNTRDLGFQLFSLSDEGNLKTKMNNWTKKSDENYTQDILALVDYIDQTSTGTTANPAPTCATGQMLPQFSGTGDKVATNNVKTRGFYVCVDSTNTVAEVYLRGNTLARLQNTDLDFNQNRKIYFPEANIRVQGLGYIFTK